MTPADYRAVRERLGLNQAQLAEQLGITFNQVSRRERGVRPIRKEAELALRFLEQSAKRKR
jgi:transcriptional regulator with XRE-family HTH domain